MIPKAIFLRLTVRALTVTVVLLFIAPLIVTGVRYWPVSSKLSRILDRAWVGRPALGGVTVPIPEVSFTWHSVRTGEFQKSVTARFNECFAGREALIRLTGELWFRLFRRPANPSSTIIFGRNDSLFERGYLDEYFANRRSRAEMEPLVRDLRILQDACRDYGIAFALVLSPTKATIQPEDIPPAWRRSYDPRRRIYHVITDLFRDYGIEFVDAVELLSQEKRKNYPAPLFPKGAMHWSRRGGLIAANGLQSVLARQHKFAEPIEVIESTITMKPEGEEGDLAELLNTAHHWTFPIEKLKIKPSSRPENQRITAAMVADSFGWSLLHVLHDSGQFSEIGFFFHYWRTKTLAVEGGGWKKVRAPATPVDFATEIFAADCLILEINEVTLLTPETHITGFLKDALAHLPDPNSPKPKFRGE
jgi:acetyltransferase AlgX (SGNH hydrolase-like protein)